MGIGKEVAEAANCCVYSCSKTFLFGWLFKLDQGLWESVRKARHAAVREGTSSGCCTSLHFWAMGLCGLASEVNVG